MTTALDVQGRRTILYPVNKSGGSVALGDVVIGDGSNDDAFTTTTTSAYIGSWVGVVIEANGIANNASGRVAVQGYVAQVNLSASVTRGHFIKTHTVAKQGADAGTSRVTGAFAVTLTTSAMPPAVLFGMPDGSTGAAGSPGTPALTLSTTNSTGAAATLVATDATIAAFDATVPVTQASGDAAATGSAGVAARRDHKHGMPTIGGKSYITRPGLKPPASPGTGDLEFASSANGTNPTAGPGLSWGNQGSATAAINQGRLVMNSATTTGLRALLKATPGSGNFQMDVSMEAFQYQGTHAAAIVMLWGTPGSPTGIRAAGRYTNTAAVQSIVWTTYNTSWAATADVVTAWATGNETRCFLRIEWDGTNLIYKFSPSGIIGTYTQITSQALGLGRPDYVGVGVNNNGAAAATIAAFDFFRFGWTADFDPTTSN